MSGLDYNKVFSENLRNYLQLANKTQADLARYLGVSTATVNYWCRGTKSPRMDKVDKMCDFFGVRRSDLMEDHSTAATPSSPAPFDLTDRDRRLISIYHRLSDSGKDQLDTRAKELVTLGFTPEEEAKKREKASAS